MKLFVVGFALLAAACVLAEVPSTDYLPPSREISAPLVSGLSGALADDGYRYKTVRRFRVRHRRSVDEFQPSVEYLSPVDQIAAEGPTSEYYAPIGQEAQFASGLLNDDGYRYKTVKRFRSRHRRSVNEVPAAEYLAPIDQIAVDGPTNEFFAPIGQEAQFASGLLNDDGYRYKTVKRFRSRHRRSVNEVPAAEYLAPIDQIAVEGPTNEFFAPIGQEAQFASGLLNDDGYRYKTVKRFRSRHRRSVNEVPAAEYLAPVDQIAVEGPTNEFIAPIGQEAQFASGLLNDDGYRYKTVKRFRSRHRRSVNEVPAAEYLAPVEQIAVEGPTNEFFAPIGQEAQFASGLLNDDGYRYKTVKRFRSRHRRSVNEVPAAEYLAPIDQIAVEGQTNEFFAPIGQEAQFASGLLNDDGYRYKTVKRFRSRHRRSVNEVPAAEYLAPIDQIAVEGQTNEFFAPIGQEAQFASGLLNDDGYRYKTVKRFRSRHRRSVNEIPAAEYLSPVQQIAIEGPTNEYLAPIAQEAQFASGLLTDDGYRYKTVKRFRSRH